MHYHFADQKPVRCDTLAALCTIKPAYATLDDANQYRGAEPPAKSLDFDADKWWRLSNLKSTGSFVFLAAFTLACTIELIRVIATGTFWDR